MTLLTDFLHFLKRTEYEPVAEKTSLKKFINRILNGFLFFILASIVSFTILILLKNWDLAPIMSDKLRNTPLSFYLLIMVPMIEEMIFRLPMRFSRINISISFAALLFVITHSFLKYSLLLSSCTSLIPGLGVFILLANRNVLLILNRFWVKNFRWIFYILTLAFGLVHLTNFLDLKAIHFLLAPLITIYQILLGFILGYYRMRFKNGIVYSVLLHIILNLPGMLLTHSSQL